MIRYRALSLLSAILGTSKLARRLRVQVYECILVGEEPRILKWQCTQHGLYRTGNLVSWQALGQCETVKAELAIRPPATSKTLALGRTPSLSAAISRHQPQITEGNIATDVRLSECSNAILSNRDYPRFSRRRAGGATHTSLEVRHCSLRRPFWIPDAYPSGAL